MSLRIVAAWLTLLAAACAASGCSGRGARHGGPRPTNTVAGTDVQRGQAVYEAQCAACHGQRGAGGPIGPSLQNEYARRPYRAVYAIVRNPDPPMPKLYPSRMTLKDVRDVSAYVESL